MPSSFLARSCFQEDVLPFLKADLLSPGADCFAVDWPLFPLFFFFSVTSFEFPISLSSGPLSSMFSVSW